VTEVVGVFGAFFSLRRFSRQCAEWDESSRNNAGINLAQS
jgi:hypothetical protein